MDNVWLCSGDEVPLDAVPGDAVLQRRGDLVAVAVLGEDGSPGAASDVSPDLLPGFLQSPAGRVDDEALLRAVRGVLTAERDRGA